MKCHVPALTSRGSSMEEIAIDGAMYFDANNHADIADKMMLIYKDETLRNKLIENAKLVVEKYNWEKSSELFWQSILKTIDD